MIPPKQVFGKNRPASPNSGSKSDSSNASGPRVAGPFRHPIPPPRSFAKALNRNKGPDTLFKSKAPNPPPRSQPKPQSCMEDKGKRHMDSEGFTTVQIRHNKTGKVQQFSSGYTYYNPFNALQHAGGQARSSTISPPHSPKTNLEVDMGVEGEVIPNTQFH